MKKFFMVCVVTVLAFGFTGCGKKESVDPNNNTNKNVISDKKVGDFSITNTKLTYNDGISTLASAVTNTSKSDQYIKAFDIIVKDKKGKEIVTLSGFIDATLKPGESRTIESNITMNLMDAYDISYKIRD